PLRRAKVRKANSHSPPKTTLIIMVKIDNLQQAQTNQTESGDFSTQNQQAQTQSNAKSNETKSSGLMTIIGQLLPLAPFAFEQFTRQKVPQMTGTIAEMQMALIQIQSNLQTIVNNQQALSQRLIALETNASHQLTTLTQQFQSLRLTHTKEQQQIEYNPNQQLTNQE
ncbi:4966_t:CDS:1, partial [Ambispora leptoticha]